MVVAMSPVRIGTASARARYTSESNNEDPEIRCSVFVKFEAEIPMLWSVCP